MFANRGSSLREYSSKLGYIVVDELHAFIGSERGKQLQSLIYRAELVAWHRPPKVGLSAKLGDLKMASEFFPSGECR